MQPVHTIEVGHTSRPRGGHWLDVFGLRERLVDDDEEYTRSFLAVRDARVAETVDADLEGGLLWPEPDEEPTDEQLVRLAHLIPTTCFWDSMLFT